MGGGVGGGGGWQRGLGSALQCACQFTAIASARGLAALVTSLSLPQQRGPDLTPNNHVEGPGRRHDGLLRRLENVGKPDVDAHWSSRTGEHQPEHSQLHTVCKQSALQ